MRIAFGDLTETTSEDGTHASAEAALLQITVLDAVEMGTLADIALAPMSVEANAPEGGVDCPEVPADEPDVVTVTKDGPDEIDPGDEFDYTIVVTNDLDCTMVDLVVVDTLTGPEGTEIVATDPEGDVDDTTVTWDDLDDLEPGESLTLTMTVAVPDDAEPGATYRNEVEVTADCDGEPVEGADVIERPSVADDDPDVLPDEAAPEEPEREREEVLPVTGGGLALAALAAFGLAAALRRNDR